MVDIIIPAYNAHDTIEQTLFSIAIQENVENFNIYIVNDCSDSDYSKYVTFFSNFMNIQEIKLDKNSGPGIARQVGIDNSKSPYIMFIDSDDVFSYYRAVIDLYNNIENGYDVVVSNFLEETSTNFFIEKRKNLVWLHGKMYRRSFLEKHSIRFNDTRANEDNGFNQLIMLCGANICFCDFFTYIWKLNDISITRKNDYEYCFKGISGYIYNISWALQEGSKRNVSKKELSSLALTALLAVYYYYLIYMDNSISKSFIKESSILKQYLDLSLLDNDCVNQIFKLQFEEFVNDNNRIKLLNPSITFSQFLKEVGDKI